MIEHIIYIITSYICLQLHLRSFTKHNIQSIFDDKIDVDLHTSSALNIWFTCFLNRVILFTFICMNKLIRYGYG